MEAGPRGRWLTSANWALGMGSAQSRGFTMLYFVSYSSPPLFMLYKKFILINSWITLAENS